MVSHGDAFEDVMNRVRIDDIRKKHEGDEEERALVESLSEFSARLDPAAYRDLRLPEISSRLGKTWQAQPYHIPCFIAGE